MPDLSARKPAVLSEAGAHSDWIARPFLEAGLELDKCWLHEVPERLATGQYNVLVLGRLYMLRKTKQQEARAYEALSEAMVRFVAEGGGIFLSYPSGGVGPYRELFHPWGAGFYDLLIKDPETAVYDGEGEYGREYDYTTHIHEALAEGVKGMWYPGRIGHAWGTRPLELAEGWEAGVTGSATSHTEVMPGSYATPFADENPPEGYSEYVPLLALRDLQPGRLALTGIPSGFHFFSPHNFPLAHQMLAEGFGGKPSDFTQVLINTCRWLAEPSFREGRLGGAKSAPDVLEPDVTKYPPDPPVIWAEREFPPDTPPRRGLIGARTAYSTGRGTVADYVARAKAAGHDFIVFLEDWKQMSKEKVEALKADCEAATDDSFYAVPGLTMEDEAGNHTFAYGYHVNAPKPDILSPDGKVLQHTPQGTPRTHTLHNVHSAYLFEELGIRCRRGTYLHHRNPIRFYDLRCFDSIGVLTWENGEIVDDLRENYRYLEDLGMFLSPTVLTFLNSPEDFDQALAAGWHNSFIEPFLGREDRVLLRYMARELEWWGTIDEDDWKRPFYRLFDNWHYLWPRQYMTSGPEIAGFTVSASGRDMEWLGPDTDIPETADWFRADVNGFRLRLKVISEVGLDRVLLYDGERLIRRWLPGGERVFEVELDLTNAQQFNYCVEAHDVNGGMAMTPDFHTQRNDWAEFFCADRNNQLNVGYEKAADGTAFGWSGTIYLTYNNGKWGGCTPTTGRFWFRDSLAPVPNDPVYDEIGPWDGGVNTPGAAFNFSLVMPPLDPPEYVFMTTPRRELISTDVGIGRMILKDGFDLSWPNFAGETYVGWSMFPVYETRYARVERLGIVFRPRPRSLTTVIFQWEVSLKQPVEFPAPLQVGFLDSFATHVLYHRDGHRSEIAGAGEEPLDLIWEPGEYLISWTKGRRPAIFINDGVPLRLRRAEEDSRGPLGLGSEPGQVAVYIEGDHLPAVGRPTLLRMLGIGGTHDDRDPEIGEIARQKMGLVGDPAYTLELETGRLVATRLVLTLDAQGAGVACRIPQADLPMSIPIVIRGLNPNWPAFLIDRETGRWRPLGMLEDTAYATLDTLPQDWNLYLGHPVTASHPEAVLSLTQISPEEWVLEAHNPTDSAMDLTVAQSPYAGLLDWEGATWRLEPGTSKFERLRGKG
jgi:hypothetical protein